MFYCCICQHKIERLEVHDYPYSAHDECLDNVLSICKTEADLQQRLDEIEKENKKAYADFVMEALCTKLET